MKIKDIVKFNEDAKITNVDPSKKTVTYSDPQTNVSTTVPDTMVKSTDSGVEVDTKAVGQAGAGEVPKIAVGANVKDVSTSEASGNDPQTATLTQLMNQAKEPWLKKFYAYRLQYLQDQKSLAGEPGAGMGAPTDAKGNLKPVETDPMKWIQQNPSIVKDMPADALPPGMKQPGVLDKVKGAFGMEETHHDTIAQGGSDVGRDPTDEFINQIRDKKWERYPRNHSANSPLTKSPLSENDELYKWLTIAGLK